VCPHGYWNTCRFFWDMPEDVREALGGGAKDVWLTVVKGDANYRRFTGDSVDWAADAPLDDVVPFFPSPFVLLRTMKSDSVVGLAPGVAEEVGAVDPLWRVNGKRGVIQLGGLAA